MNVSLYIASITRFFRVHKSIMKAIEAYYTYVDRENTGIRIAGIFARYQDENCHDISCEEEVLEWVEKLFNSPIVTDIHQVLTDCQRYVCKYDTCFELFVTLSESYDEMERMLKEGNEEERYLLRWYLRTIYYLGLGYRKLDAFRCGLIADQESLVKRDIECFIDDICDFPDEFLPYDNFLSNIQRKYLESSGWKNYIKDMVMWLYSVDKRIVVSTSELENEINNLLRYKKTGNSSRQSVVKRLVSKILVGIFVLIFSGTMGIVLVTNYSQIQKENARLELYKIQENLCLKGAEEGVIESCISKSREKGYEVHIQRVSGAESYVVSLDAGKNILGEEMYYEGKI